MEKLINKIDELISELTVDQYINQYQKIAELISQVIANYNSTESLSKLSDIFGNDPVVDNIFKMWFAGDATSQAQLRDYLGQSIGATNFSDALIDQIYEQVLPADYVEDSILTNVPFEGRSGIADLPITLGINAETKLPVIDSTDGNGVVVDTTNVITPSIEPNEEILVTKDESLSPKDDEAILILNMDQLNQKLKELPEKALFSLVNKVSEKFGTDVGFTMSSALREGKSIKFSKELQSEIEKHLPSDEVDTTDEVIKVEDSEEKCENCAEKCFSELANLPIKDAAEKITEISIKASPEVAEKIISAIICDECKDEAIKAIDENVDTIRPICTGTDECPINKESYKFLKSFSAYSKKFSDSITESVEEDETPSTEVTEPEVTEEKTEEVSTEVEEPTKSPEIEDPEKEPESTDEESKDEEEKPQESAEVKEVIDMVDNLTPEKASEALVEIEDKISPEVAEGIQKESLSEIKGEGENVNLSNEEINKAKEIISEVSKKEDSSANFSEKQMASYNKYLKNFSDALIKSEKEKHEDDEDTNKSYIEAKVSSEDTESHDDSKSKDEDSKSSQFSDKLGKVVMSLDDLVADKASEALARIDTELGSDVAEALQGRSLVEFSEDYEESAAEAENISEDDLDKAKCIIDDVSKKTEEANFCGKSKLKYKKYRSNFAELEEKLSEKIEEPESPIKDPVEDEEVIVDENQDIEPDMIKDDETEVDEPSIETSDTLVDEDGDEAIEIGEDKLIDDDENEIDLKDVDLEDLDEDDEEDIVTDDDVKANFSVKSKFDSQIDAYNYIIGNK